MDSFQTQALIEAGSCHFSVYVHLFCYTLNACALTRGCQRGIKKENSRMARQSTQHKLDRVRSPRVHITYDVETGGAIELKELPFVVGVVGDFTGQPTE